jgi:hypothetical protein
VEPLASYLEEKKKPRNKAAFRPHPIKQIPEIL